MEINEAIEIIEEFKAIEDWSQVYMPELHDAIDCLLENISPKWILCSERLPEEDGDYLVTEAMYNLFSGEESGAYMVDVEPYYTNSFVDEYDVCTPQGWQCAERVVAWMPLIEPYYKNTNDMCKMCSNNVDDKICSIKDSCPYIKLEDENKKLKAEVTKLTSRLSLELGRGK